MLGVVQAVADDEAVLDREADVFHLDVDLPARRFAEQARRPQRPRSARAEDVLQVFQREAGVDDVLDDDDVAALERRVEILEEPHLAGAARPFGVARRREKVERHLAGHVAYEIGQEDERALQDGNQVEAVREVAADVAGELGDALLNLVLR